MYVIDVSKSSTERNRQLMINDLNEISGANMYIEIPIEFNLKMH